MTHFNEHSQSFNIAYTADNDFWFQRTLFRNANAFGAKPGQNIRLYSAQTTIYKQNLDPTLNKAHRHEIVKKEGPFGNGDFTFPTRVLFNDGLYEEFPFETEKAKLASQEYNNWSFLHWNGNYLDRIFCLTSKDLDSPLSY